MTDVEKVTQGIKACWSEHFCHRCFDCPYKTERDNKKCIERLGADALELLKEQPELVRCKDCKHYTEQPGKWLCDLYEWVHEGDWFCADGEHK